MLLFYVIVLPSPWLKENSEIVLPESLQTGLILLFYIVVIPSPWLKQNHNVTNILCRNHTFTMVEENFEI